MVKKNPFKDNKYEIGWNLINCLIAGALVFVGAFADGSINERGIIATIAATLIAFILKFQSYWTKQENEYTTKIFNFISFLK